MAVQKRFIATAPELETRVNRQRDEQRQHDFQPVRILDPKGR